MSGIDDIPPSRRQYRVSMFPEFETSDVCRAEDDKRRNWMLFAHRRFPEVIDEAAAMNFFVDFQEAAIDHNMPISLASREYMRRLRDLVCSDIWRMIDGYGDKLIEKSVGSFTIVPRTWEIKAGELADVDPRLLIKALRTALYERGAAEKNGWIIAFIHGEYDPVAKVYRIHVHGLAMGEMIQAVDGLRNLPNYQTQKLVEDGKPNPVYRRVRINRKPLTNLPDPITYLLQSFWPSRAVVISDDGKRIRARQKSRIPEPYHSEVLLWLHRWRLADLTLMIGLRAGVNGLYETRVPS